MSDDTKCTSRPSDREKILRDAHLEYRHVFQDLGNASRRLSSMARSLEALSQAERQPYLQQIVEQRAAIHRAFRSMVFTLNKVFPKSVRTQPRNTKEGRPS